MNVYYPAIIILQKDKYTKQEYSEPVLGLLAVCYNGKKEVCNCIFYVLKGIQMGETGG